MTEEIKDIVLTDEQYEKLEEILGGHNIYCHEENNVGFDGTLYFVDILKAGKYLESIVNQQPTENEVNELIDKIAQENRQIQSNIVQIDVSEVDINAPDFNLIDYVSKKIRKAF